MIRPPDKETPPAAAGPVPGGNGRSRWRLLRVTERERGPLVLFTVAGVLLSTLVAVEALTAVLHALAVAPFFYAALKKNDYAATLTLTVRWAAALFVTLIAVGAFVPGRVGQSLPLAPWMASSIERWLTETGAPPPIDYWHIIFGFSALLVVSLASGAVLGLVAVALAVDVTAAGALLLFRHGNNVLQMALAAVPIWQWSLIAAGLALLGPTALPVGRMVLRIEPRDEGGVPLRPYAYMGAGLLLLAVVLRLLTAGAWRTLLQRWTVF